jgi:putative FmdB family regulatory protein
MPLFEYRCSACDHEFEALVRNGEAPACPECASSKLEKLFSAHAAHSTHGALPITGRCPPADAPPCSPHCCRLQ